MPKRIYIAGPMSKGDRIQNLAQALTAMKKLIELGYAPLCPHLTFFAEPFMPNDHPTWLSIDLPWVEKADALLRLPGLSEGATMEEHHAFKHSIPVFHSITTLHQYFRSQQCPTS